MNISEMRSWFDVIQDKFNSPYFTDLEFEEFINQGQQNFVNEIFYGQFAPSTSQSERGGQVMNPIESTLQGMESIRPLIIPDLSLNSSSGGVILDADINNAVSASTGQSSQKYMHILSIILDDAGVNRIVRFVRHNDYIKFNTNSFKRATNRAPLYRLSREGVVIDPIGVKNYKVSVVKKPINVSLENNVSCELPSEYHGLIVAYAIQLASVSSRDEALAIMSKGGLTSQSVQ